MEENLETNFGEEHHEQEGLAEQEVKADQEELRRRDTRIYYECLNVAEAILTKYIPRYKKPLRFWDIFARALFEKRKQSIEAYHEFLEAKILELQMRKRRYRTYQMPSLVAKVRMNLVGGD